MKMSKRTFLGGAAASIGAFISGCTRESEAAPAETFEVTKSPEEWRKILTPQQFAVLRQGKHRAGGFVAARQAIWQGDLRLRRMCASRFRLRGEVRQRHRLAELHRAHPECRSHQG
jgi:hypothetical protein